MKFIEIVTLVITVFISQIESASFQDKELINAFKSKIPSCNDEARLWIRAAYHDAGTFSSTDTTPVGCDGSLQFELDRPENNGLRPAIDFYKQLATKFQISMADAIAFGGIVAVQVCAPGIQISFSPGRTDAKTANPSGRLPNARISASDILSMFRDRLGFTVNELVALIGGAHSVANVHSSDVLAPGSLDATPNSLDNVFFKELAAMNKKKLPSDIALMGEPSMKAAVLMFATDSSALSLNFASAFTRMIALGTSQLKPPAKTTTASATTGPTTTTGPSTTTSVISTPTSSILPTTPVNVPDIFGIPSNSTDIDNQNGTLSNNPPQPFASQIPIPGFPTNTRISSDAISVFKSNILLSSLISFLCLL